MSDELNKPNHLFVTQCVSVELGELLELVNNSIMHYDGFPVTTRSSVITFTDAKQQPYYLVVEKQGQHCHVYHNNLKKQTLYRRKPFQCLNATQVFSFMIQRFVSLLLIIQGHNLYAVFKL